MHLFFVFLAFVLGLFFAALTCFLIYLMATICYDIRRTNFPSSICEPARFLLFVIVSRVTVRLGLLLEKLGICPFLYTLRFFVDGIQAKKDSKLIIKDLVFDEVPVRIYYVNTSHSENRRGIIHLHGGIGVMGSTRTSEIFDCYLASESDSVVMSVGFRLAPEHLFPTAIQDCCTAVIHFLKNAKEYGVDPSRIVIGGDSSGGTFAAAVCQVLVQRKDIPKVRAQFLVYPFLQAMDFNLPSHQQNHSVILFFNKWSIRFGIQYLTGKIINDVDGILNGSHIPEDLWVKYRKWISPDNIPEEFKVRGYRPIERAPFSEKNYEVFKSGFQTMFCPLCGEDSVIQELPETFILTCEYCPFRDDGLLYKKRLEDNGVQVTWHHIADGFHGILLLIGYGALEFKASRECFQHLINFLERF